ncbi:MAG: protein kinase domain-containing protein [Actinomycetes bacterium]
MIEPGRVLGDRYRLTRHIAAGGMGDVWAAEDSVLERTVAVKILRPVHATDPDFVERFRAEAKHAAALSDPHITAVHDYGETTDADGRLAYLVMEFVPGEALSTLLAHDGALGVDRTLAIVADTADALQAAHDAGVVHRDVKPGNILVRPDGSVSITDFGIARATNDPGHLTRTGLVLGTAYYLPPEQAAGHPVTPASDLYALGVVGYECLTGSRPFPGDNAVQVAVAHLRDEPPPLPGSVPEPVREFVMSLLAKDPLDRPAQARDVAATARALRSDPSAPPADTATRLMPSLAEAPTAAVALADAPVEQEVGTKRPRWRGDAYPNQRRTRGLLLLVGLAVVVIGALLLVLVGGGHNRGRASPTPTPTPSAHPTPRTVAVAPSQYVGHKYDDVAAALRALGLTSLRRSQPSDAPADTVIAITPSGRVRVGSSVTVTVAAPKPQEHDKRHGHGKGDNG